jgi:hypothetical protein
MSIIKVPKAGLVGQPFATAPAPAFRLYGLRTTSIVETTRQVSANYFAVIQMRSLRDDVHGTLFVPCMRLRLSDLTAHCVQGMHPTTTALLAVCTWPTCHV